MVGEILLLDSICTSYRKIFRDHIARRAEGCMSALRKHPQAKPLIRL